MIRLCVRSDWQPHKHESRCNYCHTPLYQKIRFNYCCLLHICLAFYTTVFWRIRSDTSSVRGNTLKYNSLLHYLLTKRNIRNCIIKFLNTIFKRWQNISVKSSLRIIYKITYLLIMEYILKPILIREFLLHVNLISNRK